MKRKPALAAVAYMENDLVHYAIQDETGWYWTGRGFSKDKRKALAYADEIVIARGTETGTQLVFVRAKPPRIADGTRMPDAWEYQL